MPLRDHFRSPVDDLMPWDGFHGGWPMEIVRSLNRKLPKTYVAAPQVHHGNVAEVDVGTFECDEAGSHSLFSDNGGGGVATAWAPPRPSVAFETDIDAIDEYEVRVYDVERGRRLVATIEIVSPANKDRPEHRRAFVAKCAALLQNHVSVAIVDLVTTRNFNLYRELLELIGQPPTEGSAITIYAAECRATGNERRRVFQAWEHPLAIGQSLPTLPLWLEDELAFPLDLEESYEETCRVLRIP